MPWPRRLRAHRRDSGPAPRNPFVREADGPRDACHLLERQREDRARVRLLLTKAGLAARARGPCSIALFRARSARRIASPPSRFEKLSNRDFVRRLRQHIVTIAHLEDRNGPILLEWRKAVGGHGHHGAGRDDADRPNNPAAARS